MIALLGGRGQTWATEVGSLRVDGCEIVSFERGASVASDSRQVMSTVIRRAVERAPKAALAAALHDFGPARVPSVR